MSSQAKLHLLIAVLILSLSAALLAAGEAAPLQILAISASADDGNVPASASDGDLETRWSASGDGNWIQFDLGGRQAIGYLGIAFYKGDERAAKFEIAVSDDGAAWTTIFAGNGSGRSNDLEAFDLPDIAARYVRFIGHCNDKNAWNSLTEFQVYAPNPTGLLLRKPEGRPKETPVAVTYAKPGFVNPDGSAHAMPQPHPVTGKTLNVMDFGADPRDNATDDAPAVQRAIDTAAAGDEVYLPDGVYNLKSGPDQDRYGNLILKDNVNLRGQSEAGTKLVSYFTAEDGKKGTTKVLKIQAVHNILISRLTVTSTFSGKYSLDTVVNNPDTGGPIYGIFIEESAGLPSYNITVDGVTVEKFQRMGIRISKCHDVAVRSSTFRNATDLGGGGAGYGVTIQGEGNGRDRLGYANDTRYNVVENSRFEGPYLRHATLIQYFAHNNLVRNNVMTRTALDAVDLHGEDEYLNEICGNKISEIPAGGAIGIGNTGATHDAAGPYNYIHDNVITNCREGIKVYLGSPDTIIENNAITGCTVAKGKGIYLLNAPRTMVRGNKIYDNRADDFWGILLAHDSGTNGVGIGDPQGVQLIGNEIRRNTYGLKIEAGKGIVVKDNAIEDNAIMDYLNLSNNQVSDAAVPFTIKPIGPVAQAPPAPAAASTPIPIPAPTSVGPAQDKGLLPTDDAYVENGKPDQSFGTNSIIRVKSNPSGSIIRIAYLKFRVANPAAVKSAVLQIMARLSDNNPDDAKYEYAVYGLTNDNWQESAITWNNSPNHAPSTPEVTGVGESAFLLGTITLSEKKNKLYTLDVTSFVKSQADGVATLMIIDLKKQDSNTDQLSKDRSNEAEKPVLIVKY